MKKVLLLLLYFSSIPIIYAKKSPSTCFGTPQRGSLKNGWQLPSSGKNFSAYSALGVLLERNYVHSKVHTVVLTSYLDLARNFPEKTFVYGESGYKEGGKFRPHKTHQNGLSIDFFVPVLNENNESVPLPTNPFNKFGYGIEFDSNAAYQNLHIDFDAIAKHLTALKKAAEANGVDIKAVIFDNAFQEKLFETSLGKQLPSLMRFSVKKPWVRHDEHYHVDFDAPCSSIQ